MSKVKLNIEIDEKTYEDLKKRIAEMKSSFPIPVPFLNSVEEYITHMIEAMGTLGGGSMGDLKDMLSKASSLFGNMDINDLNSKPEEKKEETKKPDNDKNLD